MLATLFVRCRSQWETRIAYLADKSFKMLYKLLSMVCHIQDWFTAKLKHRVIILASYLLNEEQAGAYRVFRSVESSVFAHNDRIKQRLQIIICMQRKFGRVEDCGNIRRESVWHATSFIVYYTDALGYIVQSWIAVSCHGIKPVDETAQCDVFLSYRSVELKGLLHLAQAVGLYEVAV